MGKYKIGQTVKVIETGEEWEVFDVTENGIWVDKGFGSEDMEFFYFDEVI